MNPKYTCPPWATNCETPVYRSGKHAITIQHGRGEHLATAFGDTLEEAQANARLISSSPELLAALKEAQAHLEYCGYGDPWEREGTGPMAGRIADAIAKAEGTP